MDRGRLGEETGIILICGVGTRSRFDRLTIPRMGDRGGCGLSIDVLRRLARGAGPASWESHVDLHGGLLSRGR